MYSGSMSAIKETERWHMSWEGRVLLYPYTVKKGEAVPAFTIRNKLLNDILDFQNDIDDYERELRRGRVAKR